MYEKLLKVLFVLNFLFSSISAQKDVYDNSVITAPSDQNISACIFTSTEHFVVEKTDTTARMHLTTATIFQTILTNLQFLAEIQPNIIIEENGSWFTRDTFSNVFRFTQLLNSDITQDVTMCTPYLYLRSENSSVCKLGPIIHFNDAACSSLIANLFAFRSWENNTFEITLSKLPKNTVYTFVDNGGIGVDFPNINDYSKLCKVEIDLDFISTLQNIYVSTASMFGNYELLLETFFPAPLCQKLKFNFPQSIDVNMPLYKKIPRLLAKFMSVNLKIPYACILLENDATAQVLPAVFTPVLTLFNQIFRSVQPSLQNRIKRSTFTRFFEFVFGDEESRLRTLEYSNKQEVAMTDFLMDKSNTTDFLIRHDEQILSNLYKDVRVEHYRVMDLTLKLDLEKLSRNFHTQFSLSLNRLQSFYTNHQNILLEFQNAYEHDIVQLSSCIQSKSFCFQQHGQMHCTENCFLTVEDEFYINFHLLSYKKLKVFHAQCLHTLAGQLSVLNDGMFLKNTSHYKSVGTDLTVPLQCSEQTPENNLKCKSYFSSTSKTNIMQCRNNKIVATGNISFTNPKLESRSLSFVPMIIDIMDFPIRLSDRQLFNDEICGTKDLFFSIPRKRFQAFLKKSPTFLLNQDPTHNTSFKVNFIHNTLKTFQKVKAKQIIEVAQSGTFLFSCFLAIIIFCSCLSCCFCPVIFVNMLKCILSTIIQFLTYIVEKFVHLIGMLCTMLCTIYNERRASTQQNNDLNSSTLVQQPLPEAQNMLNNSNEIDHAVPFSPVSTDTSVSLAAPSSPPAVQNESATRKALRFMTLPVRSMKFSPDTQSTEPPTSFRPTAPSPTPLYRDMPGTPRRLF